MGSRSRACPRTANDLYFASLIGLLMTGIVVVITNYYTSMNYGPVRKIAKASETGHATNIIAGLAIGQHATALPVGFIGLAILFSFHFAGLYGIAIAVMSMLSMAGIIISLDAFGPITDNAGGIAVMSQSAQGSARRHGRARRRRQYDEGGDQRIRHRLRRAGGPCSFWFLRRGAARPHLAAGRFNFQFSLTEPKVIIGLFIGGLLPFTFTAFSMDAVGKAAGAVVREVRRQLTAKPGILRGEDKPDYGTCVDIVTKAALREMIIPALLPVAFVVAVAVIKPLGPVVLGGLLVGTIVTGLVRRDRHDFERRRVGQRQEIHRRRQSRRQRLLCPCGVGHGRYGGRPLQGHSRPGDQPDDQGGEHCCHPDHSDLLLDFA